MAINKFYRPAACVLFAALAISSCGGSKKSTPPPTAPTPITASIVRLELSLPASIAPTESVQLNVRAIKSDGSAEDVTAQAKWTSSNSAVIEVSSTGVAHAITLGEATVTVAYQNRFASAQAYALPQDTYKLAGTVSDTATPLAGAVVSVISGVGEGLAATTDTTGGYRLYGVSGTIRLQVKLGGYQNAIREVSVTRHRTLDIGMTPDHARNDLSGSYTVTFTKAGCSDSLPTERIYDATVAQNGAQLKVTLGGADFIVTKGRGNSFSGGADANGNVRFTIGDTYFYYYYYYYGQYDLVERWVNSTAFIINGVVTAQVSGTRIAGALNGDFLQAQGQVAPFTRVQIRCHQQAHPFEMVRK